MRGGNIAQLLFYTFQIPWAPREFGKGKRQVAQKRTKIVILEIVIPKTKLPWTLETDVGAEKGKGFVPTRLAAECAKLDPKEEKRSPKRALREALMSQGH